MYKNESIFSSAVYKFWRKYQCESWSFKSATKTDLKNITPIDTSGFSLKTNLAGLKTEVDKLDIDKLAPVPVDLSKLSDVVKNYVVKKDVYDKPAAKVSNIDTSGFFFKN